METNQLVFRDIPKKEDIQTIREIVDSTGYFSKEESDIAVELIEERLTKGQASDYEFIFLEKEGKVLGYTCFGLIPCTHISYDLYWIVVHNDHRGKGYGKMLVHYTEQYIRDRKGHQIYVDTSSKPQYQSTRSFYLKCGYKKIALFKDFYDYGDGKVIFYKKL